MPRINPIASYAEFLFKFPISPLFQGIQAVIAETYERIHRSNLVGMGIIPLQFLEGQNSETLGLTGKEKYTISLPENLTPRQQITVQVYMAII